MASLAERTKEIDRKLARNTSEWSRYGIGGKSKKKDAAKYGWGRFK